GSESIFHHDFFASNASDYGVSDMIALARDTHKFESRFRKAGYGPSSSGDLKVLAGNSLPLAARTALSSTLKPRPGPCGSATYPSTGRNASGHSRWPSSTNGRKYSVMMKVGMHADACTVALSAMVVE